MAASDVCIVTPISTVQTEASLPHKLFQYMLMGKPVVATACAGISRVVEDAGSGVLVPPDDSDALAEALIRLTDPELRTQLGEHGRQAVRDRYSWSHAAARLLNIYDHIGHGKTTSQPLTSAR